MTKYQIAIFSTSGELLVEILKDTIRARIKELGIESDFLTFLDDSNFALFDPKAPTVGVFMALTENPVASESLRSLIRAGIMVVPVVRSLNEVNSHVVVELHGINSLQLSAEDPRLETIVGVLFEGLNLLRKRRRVFISYRRSETQSSYSIVRDS